MPFGLAYRVYRRRVPSSVKLSTGTNRSLEQTLSNVAAGEVRTLHARHHERETVTRRVRTTKHNHRRSGRCTRHPGRLDAPKGAETNRRVGSRLPKNALAKRRGHWRGSTNPCFAPRSRTGAPDASIECAPSHRIRGLVVDKADAGVATVVRLSASDPASPPDSTQPDYEPPATTTHAPYPIGWIHRHRQRLPAVDASSSAQAMMSSLSIHSPETPGRCGVRLEPCRNVTATARSPPTLPDKRLRIPSERRACRLVSHRNTVGS
jgi:hypothetical protein